MSNYNGFSNRETWAVNLYLNNDEIFYSDAYLASKRGKDFLAKCLEERVFNWEHYYNEEMLNKSMLRMFFDIGDMGLVDWDEVAESFISSEEGEE
jgi:hypothetical protein